MKTKKLLPVLLMAILFAMAGANLSFAQTGSAVSESDNVSTLDLSKFPAELFKTGPHGGNKVTATGHTIEMLIGAKEVTFYWLNENGKDYKMEGAGTITFIYKDRSSVKKEVTFSMDNFLKLNVPKTNLIDGAVLSIHADGVEINCVIRNIKN